MVRELPNHEAKIQKICSWKYNNSQIIRKVTYIPILFSHLRHNVYLQRVIRHLLRWWYLGQQRVRVRVMIGFLVRGRVRIKIRFRVRVRVRLGLYLTLTFITGTIVAGANVVHSLNVLVRTAKTTQPWLSPASGGIRWSCGRSVVKDKYLSKLSPQTGPSLNAG